MSFTQDQVNENLDNAVANGFEMREWSAADIADDLIRNCADFENWEPSELIPLVEVWLNNTQGHEMADRDKAPGDRRSSVTVERRDRPDTRQRRGLSRTTDRFYYPACRERLFGESPARPPDPTTGNRCRFEEQKRLSPFNLNCY